MVKISTVIIAQNEEHRLPGAIQSVQPFSAEILVVDGGSTDRTADVAETFGARVVANPWPGYAAQRNFGAAQAMHDWIFYIDADERVDPALAQAIVELTKAGAAAQDAFAIRRQGVFWGRAVDTEKPHTRLYNRTAYAITDTLVHERPSAPPEKTRVLPGTVGHDGSIDLHHHIEKFNRYTTLDAQERVRAGRRRMSLYRLLLRPALVFANLYLRRGLIRHGTTGFCVCFFKAWYDVTVELKIYEQVAVKPRRLA
jgi:glycosyltransferase involved in cell wall biosynthesis